MTATYTLHTNGGPETHPVPSSPAPRAALPSRFKGQPVDVSTLTDMQRRQLGLAHEGSIVDVVGGRYDANGVLLDVQQMQEVVDFALAQPWVTVDTETGPASPDGDPDDGLDPFLGRIYLFQLGNRKRQYLLWWQTLSLPAKELLRDAVLKNEKLRKLGVNLKFDQNFLLAQEGWSWRVERMLDCQLIDQIIGCGTFGNIGYTMMMTGMGEMAKRWLGLQLVKDEDVRTGWAKLTPGVWWKPREACASDIEFAQQKAEGMRKRYYAADDCVIPDMLIEKQSPWVAELGLVETVKLEMEFLPDLAESEVRGMLLDWAEWEQLCLEVEEGFANAVQALDALFDVTVTVRTAMDGSREVTRDKNYGSKDELKELIRVYMHENYGIDVIGNNEQFKAVMIARGMPEVRANKVFEKMLVPDPENPGKNKQAGYPKMVDYLVGSEFVGQVWSRYQSKLSDHAFPLPTTDSKALKLLKILHVTPDAEIDDLDTIPTKFGLPPALVDPILAFRDYTTRRQRYGYAWKDQINRVSGRIHTNTTQCAADTGRLTTRPNFQNLPGKPPHGPRYRAAVCRARPGYKIFGADFSQIEPRIIAEISNCRTYMRVFWSEVPESEGFKFWCGDTVTEPLDLYGTVGATIGVLPPDAEKKSVAKKPESKPGRAKSKVAVLGLGYGTGQPKFHITFCLDTGEYHCRTEADGLFDGFWGAVPEVKATLDKLSDLADHKKSKRKVTHPFVDGKCTYAVSLGGRKRFFAPGTNSWTQARNQPIQATGADILKATVVELNKEFRKRKLDAYVLLTAHDEIIGEAREDHVELAAKLCEIVMATVGQRYCPHVPVTAEAYTADTWIKD